MAQSPRFSDMRDRFSCNACKGSLQDSEKLPCGCKICGKCYDLAKRVSSHVFKCPVSNCAQTSSNQAKFLYSPRGVAPYPGDGFAQVHTDAATIQVVKYAPGVGKFYTERRFEVRFRVKLAGKPQIMRKPWDVAVSSDKEFFITNGTPFVHVYDEEGVHKRRFAAITPDGEPSNELCEPFSTLHGITFNSKGQLLVGDTNYQYISVLTTSGHYIKSFPVQIEPKFIASTPLNQVIVSSCECTPAELVDIETGHVKSLAPPKNEEVGDWCPTGVTCSWGEEEIYIANQSGKVGIYSFSLEGTFLEFCKDYEVNNPWGLAVSEDERHLFVSNSDKAGKSIFETDKEDLTESDDESENEQTTL